MKKIQVGFLMSYDYELLRKSIPPVYSLADTIFIALDKNFETWSGGKFEVDPSFFQWIEEMDIEKKITFYRDSFYDPGLNSMENEVLERNKLALKMGVGNWLIQIDCDEYFLNFGNFVNDLRKNDKFLISPEKTPVQIAAFLVNLYKYVDGGVVYIDRPLRQMMATNYPNYKVGRNTRERIIYTGNVLVHECVARTEGEVTTKFKNWGHSHQVNLEEFLEKWNSVNKDNFREIEDLFYMEPGKWKRLDFVEGNSIVEIKGNLKLEKLKPSKIFLKKKNFGQWFKSLWR